LSALAIMFLFNVPAWNPGAWQAQLERRAGQTRATGFWKPAHLVFPSAHWPVGLWLLALVTFSNRRFWVRCSFVGVGLDPEICARSKFRLWLAAVSRALAGHAATVFRNRAFAAGSGVPDVDGRSQASAGPSGRDARTGTFFWTAERQNRWRRDETGNDFVRVAGAFGFLWPGAARDFWPSRWFVGAPEPAAKRSPRGSSGAQSARCGR
jgi:hypothetical protein